MQMTDNPAVDRPNAWIILAGHPDAPAHLTFERYSRWARLSRTMLWACTWFVSTVATFLITIFDPFMTAMPFFVGAVMTFRSWRARFRVTAFQGACPRCGKPIEIKPGARIASPHPLVCYGCHFEPALHLAA
jgi:hypothetical protein